MSQGSNFRSGFFVALVGLSFGLALASGLLALMERAGAREGLLRLASTSGDWSSEASATYGGASQAVLGQPRLVTAVGVGTQEEGATPSAAQDFEAIPLGGLNVRSSEDAMGAGPFDGQELLLGETAPHTQRSGLRPQLLIPPIGESAVDGFALGGAPAFGESAAGIMNGLDGQEIALADDSGIAALELGPGTIAAKGIAALVQQLESENPKSPPLPTADGAARQVADASLTAFRSTATLKTLPSGRSMTWMTPGLAMTDQHNPLYLDQRGYCALTFDDGPDRIKDNRIMDILRSEGVPATFFLLGNKLKGAEATVARMLAEGHEVGNHSWSHPQLTKLSHSKAASEVERTSRALEQLGAHVRVFRPPYGAQNKQVRQIGDSQGMRMLLWDVDSLDWKLRRGASIRNEIDRSAYRGSVVLMHSHVAGTVDALPEIITDLRAKGCVFVTASQWFDGLNGYGQPLPQRTDRVENTPRQPSAPASVPAAAPTTSYQWNPSPTPVFPSAPTQPADEPIYIY